MVSGDFIVTGDSQDSDARRSVMFHPAFVIDTPPSYDRLLRLARLGVKEPEALAAQEIAEVSAALLMHYAQMGIG